MMAWNCLKRVNINSLREKKIVNNVSLSLWPQVSATRSSSRHLPRKLGTNNYRPLKYTSTPCPHLLLHLYSRTKLSLSRKISSFFFGLAIGNEMKLLSHWDGCSSNVEVLSLSYARFPVKFSGKIRLGFLGNPVQEKFYQVVKL